jgi:hypothetical protein
MGSMLLSSPLFQTEQLDFIAFIHIYSLVNRWSKTRQKKKKKSKTSCRVLSCVFLCRTAHTVKQQKNEQQCGAAQTLSIMSEPETKRLRQTTLTAFGEQCKSKGFSIGCSVVVVQVAQDRELFLTCM